MSLFQGKQAISVMQEVIVRLDKDGTAKNVEVYMGQQQGVEGTLEYFGIENQSEMAIANKMGLEGWTLIKVREFFLKFQRPFLVIISEE